MICWNVNLICVSLTSKIGRMVISAWLYCDIWSGRLKNFYVWMISDNVVDVVCHGKINGCNLYRWKHEHHELLLWWLHLSWCCDPRVASVWIMTTSQAAMVSAKMRLWSGTTLPAPVFTSGVLNVDLAWWPSGRFGFVMSHWGSWRRYLVWTIHDNVTIFITLIASNKRAISCYMSLFLTLETVIFSMWHHIDHGRWDDHSCEAAVQH